MNDNFIYDLKNAEKSVSEAAGGDYDTALKVCEDFSADEERDEAQSTAARLFAMLVA